MIVSAPTSSGKTVLFELLIAKLMSESKTKCLYLAPIKSLCQEKYNSWRKKFTSTMKVIQLTGDTLEMEQDEFSNADIYVATPEKIDYISRKNLAFLKELNLLLIDEIHMLNMEDRGAIL
jgi:ATP-dependent DNA helicase HFM1/MER3